MNQTTDKAVFIAHTDRRPKFDTAVIITSWNRDVLLNKAIHSAVNQTYSKLDIVIIDDNSSNPKTLEVISNWVRKDSRIIWFSSTTTDQERKSFSTFCRCINFALRYLLECNTTRYVSYLACDDIYYPKRVERAVKYLKENPNIGSCWTFIKQVDIMGKEIDFLPHINKEVYKNPKCRIDHNCVTHRLEILKKMSYPFWPLSKEIEIHSPDGVFFEKLVAAGGGIYRASEEILGEKLLHRDSILNRAKKEFSIPNSLRSTMRVR